jgi:hypothetical protein
VDADAFTMVLVCYQIGVHSLDKIVAYFVRSMHVHCVDSFTTYAVY